MAHSGSIFIRVQLPINIRFATQVTVLTPPTAEVFSSLSSSTLSLNPQVRSPSPLGFLCLQMSQIKEGSLPKPSWKQSWLYLGNWWLWWSEGLSNQHSWRVSISGVCRLLPQSLLVSGPNEGGLLRKRESRDKLLQEQTALWQRSEKVFQGGCISIFVQQTWNR